MASILYPQAARETDPHRMVRKVLTATRVILLVMLLAFAVLLLLPADIFEHIFGPSFNHMYRPLCLLMPGITGLALQCMLSAYFSGINRVRVNVYGALAGLFTVVIADSLLIPRYGIDGAAIASTIAYLASLALSMVYFSRKNRIGLLQFFRFRRNDLADTLQHFVKR
jgi:O-antigen/teichoic acid export membrane protein